MVVTYRQTKGELPSPLSYIASSYHLFAQRKFRIHRLWGLLYLVQYAALVRLELEVGWGEQPSPVARMLFVTMPLTGFIQAIIASRTFTFLPKANEKTQGYYHKVSAMSYDFVLENVFFSGLLLFQSAYVVHGAAWRAQPLLWLPIEILFTFFPYMTIRRCFPQSSFRHSKKDSLARGDKWSYWYAVVVKVFYVVAKHFQGYYVNYLVFLGLLGADPIRTQPLVVRRPRIERRTFTHSPARVLPR
jgi:hypothetical protein